MNAHTTAALALSTLLLAVTAGCSSDSDDSPGTPGTVTPPTTTPGNGGSNGGGDSGVVVGQIDRMGRPGVSTALIRTDEDENAYNAAGDPSTWAAMFREPMLERMRLIDGLDGVMGNLVTGSAEQLTGLLLDDRLQIDTSVPECDAYLALEIPNLNGCGGRTLERDVIDDTLRHLVSQDMPVSDQADANDATLPTEWPFLAAPFPAAQ